MDWRILVFYPEPIFYGVPIDKILLNMVSLTIKILHLGQGSFTRKVRTIFTLKIIV
jgi:hypothetical protein